METLIITTKVGNNSLDISTAKKIMIKGLVYSIQLNYNYLKRKTIERQKNTNPMTFDAMCKHNKTTANHCFCSENKLIRSNLKIDVPCSHRISMGATFQDFPDVFLNLNHLYAKLEFTHEFVEAQKTQENETTAEIDLTVQAISSAICATLAGFAGFLIMKQVEAFHIL